MIVEPGRVQDGAPAWTRPRLTRYRPGPGLAVGLVGLALLAVSLFWSRWIGGSGGSFADISRSIRHAGSARVDDTVLFAYGSWGAFVLAGATALFVLAACLPLPRTSGGNTWARPLGAAIAAAGAVTHLLFMQHLFAGPPDPLAGAWAGLAGYLVSGAGIALGARRISAHY